MTRNRDNNDVDVFYVDNSPIMSQVVDVLHILESQGTVTLKAHGDAIPSTVSIANFINDEILENQVKIQKIDLDTVEMAGIGKMTSTIQIVIKKI